MLLSADLQIGDDAPPYHVCTNVESRDCLPETVAVAFSAAMGDFYELHELTCHGHSTPTWRRRPIRLRRL